MAREPQRLTGGCLVLDSAGLSLAVERDKRVMSYLGYAREHRIQVIVSVITLVEVQHSRLSASALSYALSLLTLEPVTERVARDASDLLRAVGLHGHKYAIDALVAATALARSGALTMLTSDVDDMQRLCGKRVRLVHV
ncbi:type II toxin-antitoxin system VapC family toxin [Embleya sp. NBC_00896]|uniref:type II toxin-antitoxin system VapC family toxin n=1 Tax=Embleya sp. NBC_00896 TaxID=2975961 RepID=UPI00386458F3|nr:DNA-binding protein [Embleya sp. NBC_00896]